VLEIDGEVTYGFPGASPSRGAGNLIANPSLVWLLGSEPSSGWRSAT
jgi:hypothetical protein